MRMTDLPLNTVQPFQLETSNLRGRLVTLDSVVHDILTAHDYPLPVKHLVGEIVTLTVLLSSMLKYEGIFTLQMKGDGPVSMLVADMVHPDNVIRGCATYDEERLAHAREQLAALKTSEDSDNHLAQYLGQGYIMFTVDPNDGGERYQGIVNLDGANLTECIQHYFKQSEQINTGIKMAVGQRDGHWHASGIMLQTLPEDAVNVTQGVSNIGEDDWRRAMIFMDTATEDELLDPAITPDIMLTRLFHEEGVRVFEPLDVKKGCRCSQDRVESMIAMMPKDDVTYMKKNDKIEITCEFCSKNYTISEPFAP